MVVSLPKGTKEFLVVVVLDKLENITDLADADSVTFDVQVEDTAPFVTGAQAEISEMNAMCLIDTEDYEEGEYELWLIVDIPPQKPRLGPFKFYVDTHVLA